MITYKTLIKDRIFAEVVEEQKTDAGIILPSDPYPGQKEAVVLDVGPQVKHHGKGDKIRYWHHNAEYFNVDKRKFVFLREKSDVILKHEAHLKDISPV